jgi:hypothetical protein
MLMQAAGALSGSANYTGRPENAQDSSSTQPLLIELQGDRYVRVSNAAIDGEVLPLPLSSKNSKPTRSQSNPAPVISAPSPPADLTPVVLIFRDGHTEEVRDYTITDGILYARGDFYTDGYWNKKIDLSTLDLTQTVQANLNHNVKFILPSSPNEVITRP